MKVTFAEYEIQEKRPEFPYIATYYKSLVLVTGPGECPEYSSGIMINGNSAYPPFRYSAKGWIKKDLKPFHGTIKIECP
jgi:hypothetical protein